MVWAKAFWATALISILPTLILLVMPGHTLLRRSTQKSMLCFAVGGMLGDVFLHLVPHLLAGESHDHGHSHGSGSNVASSADNYHSHEFFHGIDPAVVRGSNHDHDYHDHNPHGEGAAPADYHHHEHASTQENEKEDGQPHYHHAHEHAGKEDSHHHHGHEGAVADGHDHTHAHAEGNGHAELHHHAHEAHGDIAGELEVKGSAGSGGGGGAQGHEHGRGGHGHGGHGGHGHSHGGAVPWLELTIMGGFVFFFMFDRIIRTFTGEDAHSHHHHRGGGDGEDDDVKAVAAKKKDDDFIAAVKKEGGEKKEMKNGYTASSILNMTADFCHNATDGLAIGASFVSGNSLGIATTLSTVFHELPHEIGDYTVLIQSGFTKWQAIGAQFCTAIGAFMGVTIGLMAQNYEGAEKLLLAFTAGGFVYVSCVTIMAEVLSSHSSFIEGLSEVLSLSAGIGLMTLVAYFE